MVASSAVDSDLVESEIDLLPSSKLLGIFNKGVDRKAEVPVAFLCTGIQLLNVLPFVVFFLGP